MSHLLRVTSRDEHRSWLPPLETNTEYETLEEAKAALAFILTELPESRILDTEETDNGLVVHCTGGGWTHHFAIASNPEESQP